MKDTSILDDDFIIQTHDVKTSENESFLNPTNNNIDILSICGASTAGAGVSGACEYVTDKGYKPTHLITVSYGSVISLPLLLGKKEAIKQVSLNLNHKQFFRVSPMTKKGNISFWGLMRILGSVVAPNKIKSIGVQDVQGLLKTHVSKKEFYDYQKSDKAVIYICTVKASTMEPVLFNIKDRSVTYQRYLDIVSASSRIPVWTQPMVIDGEEYYDGGITDINASCLLLDKFKDSGQKVNELVSIYPFGRGNKVEGKTIKGVFGAIFWLIETLIKNVGKNDTLEEMFKCKNRDIKLSQIHIPKILDSLYDVDKPRLLKLYNLGLQSAKDNFRKW